jgi:predicted dinucleotide-binding enzyme
MKIGIIGSGNIGGTVARLFVKAGHEVAIANSRGPASLLPLITELGSRAQAMTVHEAASFGDVVLLATPWRSPEALPGVDVVRGRIVIDAMNPYTAEGGQYDLGDSTASEETAKRLPGARIVKAFNTIWSEHLANEGDTNKPVDDRRVIFYAGDDAEAKQVVAKLIEEIGFAPVDTGSLREGGKRQQPGSDIYNNDITGAEARKVLHG